MSGQVDRNGELNRLQRRRGGVIALVALAVLAGGAYWVSGRSAAQRALHFERGCEALHRARLGQVSAHAEARSAFLAARGRFFDDRAAELGLSVLDAVSGARVRADDPFAQLLARGDDREAAEFARRRGGGLADDGVRLASSLARIASRKVGRAQ